MINIDKYNKKYSGSFVKLIDENFNIKNPDKKGLIDWKFFSNIDYEKNKTFCCYDDNKIIWQYSNISLKFIKNRKVFSWYICQDMCVSEKYRWKKLISKMSKELYSEIDEKTFTIWFSNINWVKVDKNSKGYWYNVVDRLSNVIFPIFFKSKNHYNYKKIKNFTEIENINFSDFDLLDNQMTINKTNKYIKWRYFDKPNGWYNFFLLEELNKTVWYVIFKKSKNTWTIFDLNCKSCISNKKVISTIKNILKEERVHFLKMNILFNDFWKNFYKWFFNIKFKWNLYFTVKNHNSFDEVDILNKKNWWIIWWDVL